MIFIIFYIKLLAVESFPDIINTQVDFKIFYLYEKCRGYWPVYFKIKFSWQDLILFMDCVLVMSPKFYLTAILWIALLGFIFEISKNAVACFSWSCIDARETHFKKDAKPMN